MDTARSLASCRVFSLYTDCRKAAAVASDRGGRRYACGKEKWRTTAVALCVCRRVKAQRGLLPDLTCITLGSEEGWLGGGSGRGGGGVVVPETTCEGGVVVTVVVFVGVVRCCCCCCRA